MIVILDSSRPFPLPSSCAGFGHAGSLHVGRPPEGADREEPVRRQLRSRLDYDQVHRAGSGRGDPGRRPEDSSGVGQGIAQATATANQRMPIRKEEGTRPAARVWKRRSGSVWKACSFYRAYVESMIGGDAFA